MSMNEKEMLNESAFTKRHYVRIAKALKIIKRKIGGMDKNEVLNTVTDELVGIFLEDNARFDEEKFRKVINIKKEDDTESDE